MFQAYDGDGLQAPARHARLGSGAPLDLARVTRVLRLRWRWIALSIALGVPLGVVLALALAPREYTAETVLLWEPPRARTPMEPQRELRTLVDMVKLPDLLAEARQQVGLSITLEALGRRVDVGVSDTSNLVTIKARARTAEESLALVEAMTRAFLADRVRVERLRAEEWLRWLVDEIGRVEAQRTAARERYDLFRKENGIEEFTVDRQAAVQEATRLRTEVDRNRIEVESEEAKAALLRAVAEREPPQILQSETRTPTAEDKKLSELRADLIARRASLSGEHPVVRGIAAAVAALEETAPGEEALATRTLGINPQWTEIQRGLIDSSVGREAAHRKWRAYVELEAAARTRVERLSLLEGQASAMFEELRGVETRLGELKAQQKLAEGEVHQPSTGFRVVAPARLPTRPTRSYRRPVAVAVPFLTGLLMAAACAAQTLRGLRIWTPAEFAFWGGAPVVATSPWPPSPEALEDLVLDLGVSGGEARGATLLLALAPVRTERAVELASRLGTGVSVWDGPERLQALRRAVRQSVRVMVLVEAQAHSVFEISALRQRLGDPERMGFVVLGLGTGFADLPDQVGDVEGFWRAPPERESRG